MPGKGKHWVSKIKELANWERASSGKPLVEILGQHRVLIENHSKVLNYQPDRIRIQVSYGEIWVQGNGLLFARLSREQLVITGYVQSVSLIQGSGNEK